MDYIKIDKKYRPIPFWSWNERLDVEETKEQVLKMHEAGQGGFFMHARGGLQTEYMSEEWFDNVTAAIEKAEECGMHPWAYDEKGWPSGFAGGMVNGLGLEYQQKRLCFEKEFIHKDTAICKCGSHYFYYEVNPHYVDVLDKKVVAAFIEAAYEPYYKRYGNRIEGIFTDEPQVFRTGVAWSFVYEKTYKEKYGENILEHLEELFFNIGEYQTTRIKFWKMVTDLFSEAYMKQIYDWCDTRGLKFTGHLDQEETFMSQTRTCGACMPHYEYMHIPGMDWLGRNVYDCLTPMQVSSVAEQFDKEAVLTESFALCGHNVSFAELKGIYEWQAVRGINLLCQHLQGYSNRGIRKRDYPPAMYIQQPWWSEYDKFIELLSRESMILREGRKKADVLVIHPQTTAWTMFNNSANEGLKEFNEAFLKKLKILEEKHIVYHLGDETLIERHGRVENGKLIIGSQNYTYVVKDGCEYLFDSTKVLLETFAQTGGHVVEVEKLAANMIIDNPEITYTSRILDDHRIHYFVNTSDQRKQAEFHVIAQRLDISSGKIKPFSGRHNFEPWGSLMLMEDLQNEIKKEEQEDVEETLIHLNGKFEILGSTLNSITLDKCDYYFDGELQEKDGYVLNICERANLLGKPVQIHQDYSVEVDYIPEQLYLVCETPHKFLITINGMEVTAAPEDYFVDKNFRRIEVSRYMFIGKNIISFDCDFEQTEKFYRSYKRAVTFNTERNKLVYDMEIEPVYLIGAFSVRTDGEWTKLDRDAVRYRGIFAIAEPKKHLEVKHIEQQGYPFFAGEMTLEGEIQVVGENPVLDIAWKGFNALKVEMNGKEAFMLTDNRLPLKDFEAEGKTKIKLTMTNNLRNLMGPHHLQEGESYRVTPGSFFKEACIWNGTRPLPWNEEYCFVEVSL